jgi:hypothetical protein
MSPVMTTPSSFWQLGLRQTASVRLMGRNMPSPTLAPIWTRCALVWHAPPDGSVTLE